MPYDLFWKGNLNAFDHYMEKARLDMLNDDRKAWLYGLYVQNAIASVLNFRKNQKGNSYPENPYLVKSEEYRKNTEEDKNILLYKKLKSWSAGFQKNKNGPSQ